MDISINGKGLDIGDALRAHVGDALGGTTATALTEDAMALMAEPRIEVVVECTGHPAAGLRHATAAIDHGKHVVMVNVEADVLAGPLLAERARRAGVVHAGPAGRQREGGAQGDLGRPESPRATALRRGRGRRRP